MHQSVLLSFFVVTIVCCYGQSQVQMPQKAELLQPDEDLETQVQKLQQNVTEIWTYIKELRGAVSNHLTHLRQHQMELESSMHKMEHLHESELRSSGYHHSGEQHVHSDDEHSHGSDHGHGSTDHHSHSDEHHSHSDEHHSHGDEHGHDSHSYSYSHHDHSKEDSHSHGGDHKDSHETEDLQTQQVVDPVAEPVIAPTIRQEHYHHSHSSQTSRSGTSDDMNLISEHSFHHHHHHHHGHEQGLGSRNRTVELPRYSDYGQYDLAICRVAPNSVLPEDQQQDIQGTVTLWQKKTGGPLNFHVKLQGFDVGGHHGHHQQVMQQEEAPAIGHKHGFHIHASGDLSNGCQSTGPHYNPKDVNHGGPHALVRHVGDLGMIECDEHGNTNMLFSDDIASLRGQYSVIGKAIVIHSKEDDFGLGGNAESLSTGNAGIRLACCVIQKVEKIPIRQYKAMKSATNRDSKSR